MARRGRGPAAGGAPLLPLLLLLLLSRAGEAQKPAAGLANNLYTTSPAVALKTVECLCDLTANQCDANCCCDTDCSANDKALFETGVCLPETPGAPTLQYCVPSSTIVTVNLPASSSLGVIRSADPSADFISQQLCIVQSNNPDLGQFFTDPGAGSAAALTAAAAARSTFARTPAAAAGAVSSYKVNDLVPAVYSSGGVSTSVEGGSFFLPASSASGGCSLRAPVGFMYDVPYGGIGATTCVRDSPAASFAADCSTLFSGDRLLNQLQLDSKTATGYVGVTITRMEYAYLSGVLGVYTTTPLTPGQVPRAAYNAATGLCEYALKKVTYSISHDTKGTLTRVEASVVLTDVAAPAAGGSAGLEQSYAVLWLQEGVQASVRPRSGTPGYRVGLPLLGAVMAVGTSTLSQRTDGVPLSVGGASGGLCGTAASAPILFGTDASASCVVPLTLTGLKGYCQGATGGAAASASFDAFMAAVLAGAAAPVPPFSSPLPAQLLEGLFDGSAAGGGLGRYSGAGLYVGVQGVADANVVAEWLPVNLVAESVALTPTWDDAKATCSNVISGLKLEFMTALVGSINDPQARVTWAQASYVRSAWTFQDVAAAATAQRFYVASTVSFVPQAQSPPAGVVPPQPALARLPDDLFYPFMLGSSGAAALGPRAAALLLAPLLALLALGA